MTYGSEPGVGALTNVAIGETSTPDSDQVAAWLNQAGAAIDRTLASAGYSVPVAAGAAVFDELAALCNQWAAAQVLRARGTDGRSGEQENRSDVYVREFWRQLKALAASDLTQVGVPLAPTKKRRRLRTVQLRRIDGYSGRHEGGYEAYDNVSD